MTTIKDKLIKKIGENIGEHFTHDIANAFAAGGELEDHIKEMVQNDEIELVDKDRNDIVKRHMSLLVQAKGDQL